MITLRELRVSLIASNSSKADRTMILSKTTQFSRLQSSSTIVVTVQVQKAE